MLPKWGGGVGWKGMQEAVGGLCFLSTMIRRCCSTRIASVMSPLSNALRRLLMEMSDRPLRLLKGTIVDGPSGHRSKVIRSRWDLEDDCWVYTLEMSDEIGLHHFSNVPGHELTPISAVDLLGEIDDV